MKILRTANAGVLLTLDGVSILLDGVCGDLPPYLATPDDIKLMLQSNLPDAVAYTHFHTDHFDNEFATYYENETGKRIISPDFTSNQTVGGVKITSVETRHIGKSDAKHVSFIIEGSKTVWFMGDASPANLKNIAENSKPDVLLAPFSYLNSPSSLRLAQNLGAEKIFVLHLPNENNDEFDIIPTVMGNIKNEPNIHILNMGEAVIL